MLNQTEEIVNVSKISFGILSAEEITKMSCCEVTSVKVADKGENIYSKFMGTIENGERCKTCDNDVWECPGHFGHIVLEHPVVNPIFLTDALNILRCVCFNCYSFLLSEDLLKLENLTNRFSDILLWLKNIKYCYKCNSEKPAISIVNETIVDETKTAIDARKIQRVLENISPETVRLLGFDPLMAHPKNFVFTVFPVLPPCCRPYVMADENYCDDDLTYQLTEIIKNNQALNEARLSDVDSKRKNNLVQSIFSMSDIKDRHLTNLKFRISTYFNNSKKKAKYASTSRPITGLKERIAGKEGQIRNNLLGKRVDMSGRTVVGPDTTLKMDELGVPKEMAEILTIPEHVTNFNIDRLTRLVNSDKANFLIKATDPDRSINLKNARHFRGTLLYFGDVVIRNGVNIPILDTKFELKRGDTILRNDRLLKDVLYPKTQNIKLDIGDIVKRQLTDGDYVLLNRQPTLHKASMMALKVVVQPTKTLKINLAITKPYNCDFDGDEMNIHVPQSYEAIAELRELSSVKKCIMSSQNGSPYMAIVQDSLIGIFCLSNDDWTTQTFDKNQFYDLLMVLNNVNIVHKMKEVQTFATRCPSGSIFNGKGLLSFLFPSDFSFRLASLQIEDGIFVCGILEKRSISTIIKTIYNDYGEDTVSDFIDNVQFMTNKYLLEKGFTINAADCLKNPDIADDIKNLLNTTMVKAQTVQQMTHNSFIREQKILGTLNSCMDQTMKKSKDVLSSQNNFKVTEESGSKGSAFNICQITNMLAQQTIDGKRVCGLIHPQDNEFKNRGFIDRSFVEGLSPRQFFHHAMAGRKGVIDTALQTSVSGYGQRQGVKLNEDIKIYPDYTVRDINGRIYQYIFGEVGYDPAAVLTVNGRQTFCNVSRIVDRLSRSHAAKPIRALNKEEMEGMLDFIQPRPCIPADVEERICALRRQPLVEQLEAVKMCDELVPVLKHELETRYYRALMTPGECVGIIGAQSMGEFTTQATLNTFHSAGSTTTGVVTNCLTRFQEINNATKNPKHVVGKIYFTAHNSTIEEIRSATLHLKCTRFKDLVQEFKIEPAQKEWWYTSFRLLYPHSNIKTKGAKRIRFVINRDLMYRFQISFEMIKESLEAKHAVVCVFAPLLLGCYLDVFCESAETKLERHLNSLLLTVICGLESIKNVDYLKDDRLNQWFVQTEGGTLKEFYALDNIDINHTTTSNIWDIYSTLGIEAAREFRIREMVEIMGSGVDLSHIKLRADRLTFTGVVQSLTRYTMRGEKPFSKVGFEEIMENFYKTARDADVDDLTGVSASIMCGKRANVGTSMFDVKLDLDKILERGDRSSQSDGYDDQEDYYYN